MKLQGILKGMNKVLVKLETFADQQDTMILGCNNAIQTYEADIAQEKGVIDAAILERNEANAVAGNIRALLNK